MGSHKVIVSCPHCGDDKFDVDDSMAVAGVPDTHIQAAIKAHTDSNGHFMRGGAMDFFPGLRTDKPEHKVTGRIADFTHGKDHNDA